MNPEFSSIVEECTQRLRQGQSVGDCLKAYPEQAEMLRPLLLAAARVYGTQKRLPRVEAVEAGRARMLAAAQSQFNSALSN